MAIRDLKAPASTRVRKSKYPFTDKECEQAIKMLKEGKTPGVGPYEGESAMKEARSAGQSLVRHITNHNPDFNGRLGTKAWEDEEGAHCIVTLREQSN